MCLLDVSCLELLLIHAKTKCNFPVNDWQCGVRGIESLKHMKNAPPKRSVQLNSLLNQFNIVFLSMKACMRKVEDNPIKLSHSQIRVKLHFGCVHSM